METYISQSDKDNHLSKYMELENMKEAERSAIQSQSRATIHNSKSEQSKSENLLDEEDFKQ
eukprot:403352641